MYMCRCPAGFEGRQCEIRMDSCASNPCQNGGTCSVSGGTATCTCPAPFVGPTCAGCPAGSGWDGTMCVMGLVAHWRMDETSGTSIADSSGNGFNATASAASWTGGRFGGGFSGQATTASVPASAGRSVSLWVRRTGSSTGNPHILDFGGLSLVDLSDSGTLGVSPTTMGLYNSRFSFGAEFHHVVITLAGNDIALYWDGNMVGPDAGGPGVNAASLSINGGAGFAGVVDDLRVYSRVLTTAEIQALASQR